MGRNPATSLHIFLFNSSLGFSKKWHFRGGLFSLPKQHIVLFCVGNFHVSALAGLPFYTGTSHDVDRPIHPLPLLTPAIRPAGCSQFSVSVRSTAHPIAKDHHHVIPMANRQRGRWWMKWRGQRRTCNTSAYIHWIISTWVKLNPGLSELLIIQLK